MAISRKALSSYKLDDLATPDDNTDLDFSTTKHGLVPKGTDTGAFLKDNGGWGTPTDTTYSAGSTTTLGLIKLEDDTVQATAANTVTTTTSRTYGVQVNGSGQGVVNVPWVDTNTTYSSSDFDVAGDAVAMSIALG